MAFLRLLGTSSQLPDLFLLGEGCGEAGEVHVCHGGDDTEATKVTGLRFSFFPRREYDMELLQEELDKMEMSCLRGESAHEVGGVVAVGHRSEALTHPHLVLGHVCYPRVSPSSARARATSPECPHPSPPGDRSTGRVSPPRPYSFRALVPGAAPGGGRGHSWIRRAGVTRPWWPEDNAELMRGEMLGGMSPSWCCPPKTCSWGASWVSLRVRSFKVGVSSPRWHLWVWDNPLGDGQGWGRDTQGRIWGGRGCPKGWPRHPRGQGTPAQSPFFPNQVTPELVMDVEKRWEPKPCSPRANM